MEKRKFWTVAAVAAVVLVTSTLVLAQDHRHLKLSGVINDFTPASASGPWEIRGTWSLRVDRETGKAQFSAALTMERSDQGVIMSGGGDFMTPAGRHAHTHHITLVGGDITPLSNGFRVTGTATVAGNGGAPPDFDPSSPIQIDITGGTLVPYSNLKLSFSGPAATHFGTSPFNGVVRRAD